MSEHRRSMQALRRAAVKAATAATVTAASRPAPEPDVGEDGIDNVRSLAAARARRSTHPAGSARAQ